MTVSIFTTIQVFAWLATIWRGRPVATASMYYAVGSIVLLVIGGLSGRLHRDHSRRLAGAQHLFRGRTSALRADRRECVSGFRGLLLLDAEDDRPHDERADGQVSFWVMFIGFNLGFFPMHNLGLLGMPRRIFTYRRGWGSMV